MKSNMVSEFEINGRRVGLNEPPYIIAEAGSNFDQSLAQAKDLIDVAAQAKVDAVKFQLFRAEVLYPDRKGDAYQLFRSLELNPEWVPELAEHAQNQGIDFLASPFDSSSLQVLDEIGVGAYKIASSETTNLPLVHAIASRGKPVLISTGMCDMVDVEEAIGVCIAAGNRQIALLQCGSVYPLPACDVNLQVIETFRRRYHCSVGFSDHTLESTAAIAAVALGARVIEKHFTLSRELHGPDHSYALEPDELKHYVSAIRNAFVILGSGEKELLPQERQEGRRFGLYAARDLNIGDSITAADLVARRPALGLRQRYRDRIIGMEIKRSVKNGDPITWDVFGKGGESWREEKE